MALDFSILDWRAWTQCDSEAAPDVSVIPPLLRRRLSPMGRAAVSVIMPLAEGFGPMPLVYVSRHGDLNRTLGLLQDLARGELLSPTDFSLSVHNATAGLYSIHQGLTKNIVALSGGHEELVPSLLECLGLCSADEPNILCVCCDEPPPSLYGDLASQPAFPYAVAFVLSRGTQFRLTAGERVEKTSQPAEPQALQWLPLLRGEGDHLHLPANGTRWELRRCNGCESDRDADAAA